MVCIATHNSDANLLRLVSSIAQFGTDGQQIVIVASGDTSKVEIICATYDFLSWIPEPTNGFETGAWIAAYDAFPDEEVFLFLQDSMEVTAEGWYTQFRTIHQKAGYPDICVPWVTFTPYLLGVTPDVAHRILSVYGNYEIPAFGIFGSQFYTTRNALNRVKGAGYFGYRATDKVDSEGFERWWALFFTRLGIPVIPVNPNGYSRIHEDGSGFFGLRKHFHTRSGGTR